MIAARKRNFAAFEVLYSENTNEKSKANTRLLICKRTSHQPIYTFGYEIIIFAVHGHHETMKKPFSEGYKNFWKRVKWAIETFKPHFFLGDFNMALLLVPKELSCCELPCHVLAYYPWRFTERSSCSYSQTLGLDSCGIFYVQDGDVESRLNWPASHIPRLLIAGNTMATIKSDWGVELHSYEQSKCAPGQPWWCYKPTSNRPELPGDTHLETMLQNFLSTRMSQEAWQAWRGDKTTPVEWIRFRQKDMPQESVFVNGEFHGGAHMNLMVFTHNSRSFRSKDAEARIKKSRREKWEQKLEARAKAIPRAPSRPRSPSRSRSQSRPRWYESDWTDACHWGDASWSSHHWNNDPYTHHGDASWGGHQWNNGHQSW